MRSESEWDVLCCVVLLFGRGGGGFMHMMMHVSVGREVRKVNVIMVLVVVHDLVLGKSHLGKKE